MDAVSFLVICKDPKCGKIIPPREPGKTGPPRKFCSRACALRYHKRMWARRARLMKPKAVLAKTVPCRVCQTPIPYFSGKEPRLCDRCKRLVYS